MPGKRHDDDSVDDFQRRKIRNRDSTATITYLQLLLAMVNIFEEWLQLHALPSERVQLQSEKFQSRMKTSLGIAQSTYKKFLGYVTSFMSRTPHLFSQLLVSLSFCLDDARRVVSMFNHAGYPVQFDESAFHEHGAASALSSGPLAVTHRDLIGDATPCDESGLQLVNPSPKFQLIFKIDLQDLQSALQSCLPLLSADVQRSISEALTAKDFVDSVFEDVMQRHGLIGDEGLNRTLYVYYVFIKWQPTCVDKMKHFFRKIAACGSKTIKPLGPKWEQLGEHREAWFRTFSHLLGRVQQYATDYNFNHKEDEPSVYDIVLPMSKWKTEKTWREYELQLFERNIDQKPAFVKIKSSEAANNHRRYRVTIPPYEMRPEPNDCIAAQWKQAVDRLVLQNAPQRPNDQPERAAFVPFVTVKTYDDDERSFSDDSGPARNNRSNAAKQTSSNEVVTPAGKNPRNDDDLAARCQPSTSGAPPQDDYSQHDFNYCDFDYNNFDYNDFEEMDPALPSQPSTSRGPPIEDDVDDKVAATPEEAALEGATVRVATALVASLHRAGFRMETIQQIIEDYVRQREAKNQ